MPKYKTQTNDLTEVIEAGGGSGKLYMHIIDLYSLGNSLVEDDNNKNLIASVNIYMICNSPVPLKSWEDYSKSLPKNKNVRLLSNYISQYVDSQVSVVNSCIVFSYNGSLYTTVEYYTPGNTNLKSKQESISIYFKEDAITVIPLG